MDQQLPVQLHQIVNDTLVWIGFGTLVGLTAKAIMPGPDPGGAIATLMMGVGGSVIGSGVLAYFQQGNVVTPISPMGFVVATAGAFVLLFFYRLLSGRFHVEQGDGIPRRESTTVGRPWSLGRRRTDRRVRLED